MSQVKKVKKYRGRMSDRVRLLVIAAGILSFCAMAIVIFLTR